MPVVRQREGSTRHPRSYGSWQLHWPRTLLRAEACETVTASTELVAAAIPDQIVVELYTQEPSFRNWCNQELWPAEIAALLEKLLHQ